MSCFLVFSNLPAEITEEELEEVFKETGPSDRTSVKLMKESGEVSAWVGVPWSSSVAGEVAKKINGRLWRGHELHVYASTIFKE